MSSRVTFILGGAASGKSAFAESLCVNSGKDRVYLATSQVFDDEMRVKVDKHVVQRGAGWTTYEEFFNPAAILSKLTYPQICLLDCATMWLTNHLMAENCLQTAQNELLQGITSCDSDLVIVSNETGIVPENALARRFREAQGRLNIELAKQAGCVVQVTAGIPLVLKGEL